MKYFSDVEEGGRHRENEEISEGVWGGIKALISARVVDGSLWMIMHEYEYMYEYYPDALACPSQEFLIVGSKKLNAKLLSPSSPSTSAREVDDSAPQLIESKIDGEFTGWDGETIFKLMNGQIWQQVNYSYVYRYIYAPNVIILPIGGGYELHVEGLDRRIKLKDFGRASGDSSVSPFFLYATARAA